MYRVEVFTEGHEIQGPRTHTGSGLYFKWSAGSGSGLNLLLRVPGRFNIVWTMIMDSFMSDAKKKKLRRRTYY